MHIPLYSSTHLTTARAIFPPERFADAWYDQLWTEEELNACKQYEWAQVDTAQFNKRVLDEMAQFKGSEDYQFLKGLISKTNPKEVRSVGCGLGWKEIALAEAFPQVRFHCDDIAPYLDRLNRLTTERNLTNIEFQNSKTAKYSKADLTLCIGVIYCIPPAKRREFCEYLGSVTKDHGWIYLLHVAYLNYFHKLRSFVRSPKRPNTKQTGWRMDRKALLDCLPASFKIVERRHGRFAPPSFLKKLPFVEVLRRFPSLFDAWYGVVIKKDG
jgi:hypothetical protein